MRENAPHVRLVALMATLRRYAQRSEAHPTIARSDVSREPPRRVMRNRQAKARAHL